MAGLAAFESQHPQVVIQSDRGCRVVLDVIVHPLAPVIRRCSAFARSGYALRYRAWHRRPSDGLHGLHR